MAAINLKDLNQDEFKKFLDSFDVVMADIDGTVSWGGKAMPGVPHFFNKMQELGKSVYYVSNNSLITDDEYMKKMKKCDLNVEPKDIIHPALAVVDYLKGVNFDKHIFCIGAQETIDIFTLAGFKCKTGPVPGPRRYIEYPAVFVDDPEIGAVFIDHDFHVNMAKAYMASVYLERPEVIFLVGAADKEAPLRRVAGRKSLVFLPNVLTDAIVKYTERQPIVLSKPSKDFAKFVNKYFGIVVPSRVLFVGDCLQTDVDFGKNAGYKTLYLLTTATYEMIDESKIVPDYYLEDLAKLSPLLSHL